MYVGLMVIVIVKVHANVLILGAGVEELGPAVPNGSVDRAARFKDGGSR